MQLKISSHDNEKKMKSVIRREKVNDWNQIWNMLEWTGMDIDMVIVTVAQRFQKQEKTKMLLKLGKYF